MDVLIWSNEHNAWWAPNDRGYTQSRPHAGEYPLDRAIDICIRANRHLKPGKPPHEAVVPIPPGEVREVSGIPFVI